MSEAFVRVLIQTRNCGQITCVEGDRPIDHFVFDADEHTPRDIPEEFRPLAIRTGAVSAEDYLDADQTPDYEAFESRYTLVPNPNSGTEAQPASCFFQTFDEDLAQVLETHAATPRRVWTVVDGHDGREYIIAGYRPTGRTNHLITEEEWRDEAEAYGNFCRGEGEARKAS